MQRKAYVPGVAVLLTALLAGCTSGSEADGSAGDAKQGGPGASVPAAEPGRYRTLPEPCGALNRSTLDSLLPGIKEIADEEQRNKAYEGTATATYDTDRRVGCRWKAESVDATHHLLIDLDRVVSYDGEVSDEERAQEVYEAKKSDADIPEPARSSADTPSNSGSSSGSTSPDASGTPDGGTGSQPAASDDPTADADTDTDTDSSGDTDADSADELLPRVLDDLGDAAFIDDAATSSGSAQHREVTVVFRTSNVIVTIGYEAQPTLAGEQPDSKDMQDRARNLAARLADRLSN
ncbi:MULTISPECIES: DUF3558 domain-containing protein [unclassified Streptomyces]|uniref:DUF3558 domain-containing protein n=1 Tax=Streptomyces sp. NPDC005955 TaxID=3364738 RepID=UPI003689455A